MSLCPTKCPLFPLLGHIYQRQATKAKGRQVAGLSKCILTKNKVFDEFVFGIKEKLYFLGEKTKRNLNK